MRSRSGASSRVINLVALAVAAALGGLPAFAMETHKFDIPEESASAAIRDFGAQAHVQVLVAGEYVKNKKLHAVSGNLSTEVALVRMLEGSGLTHKYVGDGSIALIPTGLTNGNPQTSGSSQPAEPGKGGQDPSGTFLLAQAAQGQSASAASVTSGTSQQAGPQIQEVIVTAQKKSERLQDVPVPVTSLNAEDLMTNGQVRLTDYYDSVPGLTYYPDPRGFPAATVTIRGLSSGGGNPTVAILIDGIPFGSSLGLGAGYSVPDLDPGDISRIEVLRGPQGTLYGASSIGGTINFITTAPSTDGVSGHVESDLSGVVNGTSPNSGLRGSVNVPITDELALRASAFYRHDAGYIYNVQTSESGVNWGDAEGGRVAALWKPAANLSVELTALLQNNSRHGSSLVFFGPQYGNLQQNFEPGTGWSHSSIKAYSAIVNASLGGFEFTSLTSYNTIDTAASLDFSILRCCTALVNPAWAPLGAELLDYRHAKNFSEELRAATHFSDRVDLLLGGFYTHQSVPVDQQDPLINDSTGVPTGDTFGHTPWYNRYQETAGFLDVTIHFTSAFNVQLGGRESFIKQYFQETDYGPLVELFEQVPSPAVYPAERTSQSAFTYLVTPQRRISEDLMTYARIASGYRPGGPNANDLGTYAPQVPPEFGSDRSKNYEVGVKGEVFDRRVTFDASVYYIDWKNLQINLTNPGGTLGYVGNASGARSKGVEASVEAHPVQGLRISAWGALNRAALTDPIPTSPGGLYGMPGNQLPNSARLSGNFQIEQEFPITGAVRGYIGGTVGYLDKRYGLFRSLNGQTPPSPLPRAYYPAYGKTDLNAGARFDGWTVNLFVNNVADKRGLLSGGPGQLFPNSYTIISPRTIGISISKSF